MFLPEGGVLCPEIVETRPNSLPIAQGAVFDVGYQLLHVGLGHQLAADVEPGLGAERGLRGDGGAAEGLHGVVDEHVLVGVDGFVGLEDDGGAAAFLLPLCVDGVAGGGGPPCAELVDGTEDFVGGVGREVVELDVLCLVEPLVALCEFPAVAVHGIHVVEPPVGGHDFEPVFGDVVADQGEGQGDVELGGVVAFCQQAVGGEARGMLEGAAEAGPESASGGEFVVGGAGVVVGTYGGSCGDVALSHDEGGDEEGVVVVLLVGGEDDAVAHLAACEGGVVAHNGVVEAKSEFEVHVLAEEEPLGDDAVGEGAAVAYDAVGEGEAGVDGGGVGRGGEDGDVADDLGMEDDAGVPYPAETSLVGGEVVAGKLLELVHEGFASAVAGP